MPKELKSKDDLAKLLEEAVEVRVVRHDDTAKLKVRTKETLYTYKGAADDIDALTKGLKVPIVEY
jgi:hypothetical protein